MHSINVTYWIKGKNVTLNSFEEDMEVKLGKNPTFYVVAVSKSSKE